MPALIIVLLLGLGVIGTTLAAQESHPGDMLYSVKTHVNEPVQAMLSIAPQASDAPLPEPPVVSIPVVPSDVSVPPVVVPAVPTSNPALKPLPLTGTDTLPPGGDDDDEREDD